MLRADDTANQILVSAIPSCERSEELVTTLHCNRTFSERNSPSPNSLQHVEGRGASRFTKRKSPSVARRIARLDWLSSSILHDLRNPVATIYASSEILMNSNVGPSEIKRLVGNMHAAAARMRKLLTEVVCVISGKRSATEICDISDVIAAAAEAASASTEHHSVRVSLHVPRGIEVPLVRCQIERVFFNLIINAYEAMPCGGDVRICAWKAGNHVVLEVEDTGPGIPNELREKIFHPFVTSGKNNGLGLGLSLARLAILDHGGDLWIETAPGARFVMRLPLSGVAECRDEVHPIVRSRRLENGRRLRRV